MAAKHAGCLQQTCCNLCVTGRVINVCSSASLQFYLWYITYSSKSIQKLIHRNLQSDSLENEELSIVQNFFKWHTNATCIHESTHIYYREKVNNFWKYFCHQDVIRVVNMQGRRQGGSVAPPPIVRENIFQIVEIRVENCCGGGGI